MQESDLLDQLPDGEVQQGSGTDHIMLVSLGCFCGPKLSFKHMGRGAETLPFDWMRTTHSGLMHFLRHDFDGFFDFASKIPVPNCNMTTYRSSFHSFWHDDPTDPGMLERYRRRIDRFNAIDASTTHVLFVRTIPTTDELADAPALLGELMRRHGKHACLLLIIDFQFTAKGAAIVEGHENLLVFYLSGDHHVAEDGITPAPPYTKPVACALDWMSGKAIQAMNFKDMDAILACADETHWGLEGLGGLWAFEPKAEEPALAVAAPAHCPAALPLVSAELLEKRGATMVASAPADDGMTLVSLGCSGLTKLSLQRIGRGGEALPFDWTRLSHEGLLHFLQKGFRAPIREGLGAGGQRPMEREGFFDFCTRRPVPGTELKMCRSHLHSFWHDDLADPEMRAKYNLQIDRFDALGESGATLLFARAVATTAELARADELLGALSRRFGSQAALLLVVDFQTTTTGAYVVDGYEDLLVYFQGADAHSGKGAEAPYQQAVECALDWLQGNPLEANCVADLQTLHGLADETHWGFAGLGGLDAFEGFARDTPATEGRGAEGGAEVAWLEAAKLEATKESIALISLGSHPGTTAALVQLDLAVEASPFDQARVGLDGVLKFLRQETSVEQHFARLARSDRPKLFVHAVASTEDLAVAGEVQAELGRCFRGHACLLLLVGGQAQSRIVSVDGHYNVLAYFLPDTNTTAAGGTPYLEAIRRSLDWVVGAPLQASVVISFEALRSLAGSSPVQEVAGHRTSEEGATASCSASSSGDGSSAASTPPPAGKEDAAVAVDRHDEKKSPATTKSTVRQGLSSLFGWTVEKA